MIGARVFVVAILLSFVAAPLSAADQIMPSGSASGTAAAPAVAIEGKVKQPQSLDLAALRRLPAEQVQISFQSERKATTATYIGARLWAVLAAAGGIDDDQKGAKIRHVVKITGRDGYIVVISTGEIAPDFGGKPALIAFQRDNEAPGETGLRLVMPGDKRGGRDVRDVVAVTVE